MAVKLGSDFFKQISRYYSKTNSFDGILRNLKIITEGNGKCHAELLIDKEHINLHGGLHGGVTATLIDSVSTYALMSKRCNPRESADMQIMYITSALEGDSLIIDAHTVQSKENLALIECELRRKSDGALIAKGAQKKYVDFK